MPAQLLGRHVSSKPAQQPAGAAELTLCILQPCGQLGMHRAIIDAAAVGQISPVLSKDSGDPSRARNRQEFRRTWDEHWAHLHAFILQLLKVIPKLV